MATAYVKVYIIGMAAHFYARKSMKKLKVGCVVPSVVLKEKMIEMLSRLSYCMEIYTVAEFYLIFPQCDVLFIDEFDYMVN